MVFELVLLEVLVFVLDVRSLALLEPQPVVLLVVAAIAALVGGFIHLWRTNDEFKENVIVVSS